MNSDQVIGSLRQLLLAASATELGTYYLEHLGVTATDAGAAISAVGVVIAFVWQLFHHRTK